MTKQLNGSFISHNKNIASAILTLLLFIVLLRFYSFSDFIEKIITLSFFEIIIILGVCIFFFISTGIELFFYFKIYSRKKINFYDVVSLPFVMNLWGHILPFQGSFIYNAVYMKSKYSISINSNFKVYLFQFVCSVSIGICMLLLFKINNHTISPIEYPIYVLIMVSPFFYDRMWALANKIINKILPQKFKSEDATLSDFGYKKIVFLLFINLVVSGIYSSWLYTIAEILDYNIPFFPLFIAGILSKIALLFRFTPGNLGINQFTFAGIFALMGLQASQGVDISLYVSASYFIISFTLGMIFHIVNMKHIKLSKLLG